MVYQARDRMLERTVAIKTLRRNFSDDPEFRQRFRQEAKAAAKLTHPNIVTVHDFGLESEQLYIVMEYVPGVDLKTLLRQHGRLKLEESLHLLTQACAGIGYAHRAGLVHCDVKPQNMLVTPDRLLKVTDFGIARALITIKPDEKEKMVWGSPSYFSPEQASGSAPSPASDVYALGVILYEMTTGVLPFSAETSQELARMHRQENPPPPRSINNQIPIPLETIILKTLSKDPQKRFQSAGEMGRALVSFNQILAIAEVDSRVPKPSDAIGTTSVYSPPKVISEPDRPKTYLQTEAQVKGPQPLSEEYFPKNWQARLEEFLDIEWVVWVLVFLVLISVGGLIPFWLWVYYTLNPPA